MPVAVINIREHDTIPVISFIVAGLVHKYKKILLNVEYLPEQLEIFLTHEFKVKIKKQKGCDAYNYLLQIKGIKEKSFNVEHKNDRLFIYLNTPKLMPADIKIVKMSGVENYSDAPMDDATCRPLRYADWVEGLEQSQYDWASLLYAFHELPLTRVLQLIEQDQHYGNMFAYIKRTAQKTNEVYFENPVDFNLALVLIAVYNFSNANKMLINLAGQLTCIPVINNGQLECQNTVFGIQTVEKPLENTQLEQDVENNDTISPTVDINQNVGETKIKQVGNKQVNYKQIDKPDEKVMSKHSLKQGPKKTVASPQNIKKEKVDDSSNSNNAANPQEQAIEIDVESWALRIQEMLDS